MLQTFGMSFADVESSGQRQSEEQQPQGGWEAARAELLAKTRAVDSAVSALRRLALAIGGSADTQHRRKIV